MHINPLLKAAEVLEKVAAVFEEEEKISQEKHAAEVKANFIDPISSAIPDAPENLREKLAQADPELLEFLKTKFSKAKEEEDYSLGEYVDKFASISDDDYSDKDALLAFCMSED